MAAHNIVASEVNLLDLEILDIKTDAMNADGDSVLGAFLRELVETLKDGTDVILLTQNGFDSLSGKAILKARNSERSGYPWD